VIAVIAVHLISLNAAILTSWLKKCNPRSLTRERETLRRRDVERERLIERELTEALPNELWHRSTEI